VIEADEGLSVVVYVDGERRISSKRSFTINSLLNPGKQTKLFGGKKPYASCEIYAIEMMTDFKSEWGLGGPAALACRDAEFEVDAKAVCFGSYNYVIDDYFSFIRSLPMGSRDALTRDDMREYFRSLVAGVASMYLAGKLGGKDVSECQPFLAKYAEDIKAQLNIEFDSKGLTVKTFTISQLDFEPAHKINREMLKEAKIGVKIKGVVNEGHFSDIAVNKAESEVDIGIINALKGNGEPSKSASTDKVACPRCGEQNDSNTNYCYKCGEALRGKSK
jgi:membrane protease subunit (stomatin/prohibitin family)